MKKYMLLKMLTIVSAGLVYSFLSAQGLKAPIRYFVTVEPDVELEIVEWSDQGEPLILLAGLGHSAHVFDEFAPLLADRFRVLGITRRGFGASSQPQTGYDLNSLANDIRTVMDSLGIEKAIIAGHSFAGDEMTKLASLYSGRIKALIYLDAAYDHIFQQDTLNNYPVTNYKSPSPTDADLLSPEAYRQYYFRKEGVLMPISEIKEINIFGDDGGYEGGVTPGTIYASIINGMEHPNYSGIDVPALAIYAVSYPITEVFTHYDSQDAVTKKQMQKRFEVGLKMDEIGRQDFKRRMINSKVVELEGAGHSLYLTHAEEVAENIRKFIDELQ